jgi:hypothetical protein
VGAVPSGMLKAIPVCAHAADRAPDQRPVVPRCVRSPTVRLTKRKRLWRALLTRGGHSNVRRAFQAPLQPPRQTASPA